MSMARFCLMLRIFPETMEMNIQAVEETLQITDDDPNVASVSKPDDPGEGSFCIVFDFEEEQKDFDARAKAQKDAIQRAIAWLQSKSVEQFDAVRALGLRIDMLLALGTFYIDIPYQMIQELSRLRLDLRILTLEGFK